ncbi:MULTISPECIES: hypothetical protein [Providencia]|uniref:hypothetical protein n=1 Tax=Providencia TaxID=586 RepID=UPI0015EBFF59|nr:MULTISPECIES: hypothetical protein [Providencia]ELR5138821.1 hypothetical protein [Providencia rettgeri]ELR5169371.1 hypothetical protein [Providencia rettgeri]QLQ92726.1 hypothetical protein H0907_15735 [Providencia rettgeri]WEB83344.1 hypothetical protein LVJ10_15760 [Providencia rettgeri]HCH7936081.1 hypothetical protein [Providencia rettgeri]
MKKNHLLCLLSLFISSAYAVDDCRDELRNTHRENLHLMTQKIVYGPIKSIKSVSYASTPTGSPLDTKTLQMQFSTCSALESYQSESKWFLDKELNSSLKRTIQKNPTYEMVNIISFGQPIQSIEGKFTFEQDPSGKISTIKTHDQAGNDYTVSTTYKNGKIDSTKGFTEGVEVFYQYSYDDQGKLVSMVGNSGQDIRQFSYDTHGFFKQEIRKIKLNNEEVSTTIECLETDKFGNCLTEKLTNSRSNLPDTLIETFKYQYEYY